VAGRKKHAVQDTPVKNRRQQFHELAQSFEILVLRQVHPRIRPAVFAGVGQIDSFVSAGFQRVNLTPVHGALIDVHAYGALEKTGKITDLVDALFAVYVSGLSRVEFHAAGGNHPAGSPYWILRFNHIVLDKQPAARQINPPQPIVVVVHGSGLPNVPTESQTFEDFVLENQIAGIAC
jgi:hypothetical protein